MAAIVRIGVALAIPQPHASVLVGWRRAIGDPEADKIPPHVTLLIPAPPDVDTAVEALRPFGAFDVAFAGFGRFPRTLWLAPEPAAPFVAMTEALVATFPGHPPYGGLFDEITPHVTVAQGEELDAAETAIATALPLASRAASVVLFEQVAGDRWVERAEFAL